MKRQNRPGRKLLIASLGVAAVSYVACGGSDTSDSGNTNKDASVEGGGGSGGGVGNLVPPDTGIGGNTGGNAGAGGTSTGGTAGSAGSAGAGGIVEDGSFFDQVANLVPPDLDAGGKPDNTSFFDQVANLVPPDFDAGNQK